MFSFANGESINDDSTQKQPHIYRCSFHTALWLPTGRKADW